MIQWVTRLATMLFAITGVSLFVYYATTDQSVVVSKIDVAKISDQVFELHIVPSSAPESSRRYIVYGDQFRIDSVVGVWKPLLSRLNIPSRVYFDRLSGRYKKISDEHSKPRTVISLRSSIFGVESLTDLIIDWVGVDFVYGSSAFMPLKDGISYDLSVSNDHIFINTTQLSSSELIHLFQDEQ